MQHFQELCSFWVSLCVRHCQLMCDQYWTGHAIGTPVHDSSFGPQRLVESLLRVSVALFPRLSQNLMHTRCSFPWSIVKIATGHLHDSKQMHVKTAHIHPATCNLAHWLTRHGSPTIHRCFALPQLLYRWWHQFGKLWVSPLIIIILFFFICYYLYAGNYNYILETNCVPRV